MKRVVCVAIFAVLILAGCNGSQEVSNPTPAATTLPASPTPSPVVQAQCPEPTACPGPTACLPAPTCPEPVTCPTCAEPITCPTCPQPVVCPTCPEPIQCATCPTCPEAVVCPTLSDEDTAVICTFWLAEHTGLTPQEQFESCNNARSAGAALEANIILCEDVGWPCTYQREQLAVTEDYLNAYCR
jgi:hypothetical protein